MIAKLLFLILLTVSLLGCSSGYNKIPATHSAQASTPLIAVAPLSNSPDLQLGQTALNQGEYTRAIELFNQAYQKNNNDWEALFYLGLVHTEKGDYSDSRNYFERALNKVGGDKKIRSRVYCAVARSWEREGRVGSARLNYFTANNLDPESTEATAALLRLSSGHSD